MSMRKEAQLFHIRVPTTVEKEESNILNYPQSILWNTRVTFDISFFFSVIFLLDSCFIASIIRSLVLQSQISLET